MVRPINDTEIRVMVPHAMVEWIRAEIEAAPGDEGYREAFDDFVRSILLEYSIHRRGHGATIDVTRAIFRAARKLESEYDLPIVEAETRAEAHERAGNRNEAQHWWAVWRFLMNEEFCHPRDDIRILDDRVK